MSGAKRDILVALAVIIIPMLGLSALILGLVIGNEVEKQTSDGSPLAFDQRSDTDTSAYYVDFNATTLATIASWSSTLAPLLAVAAMALASFSIAKKMKEDSNSESMDLPTPYQFSLLVESLSGGVATLFSFGKYSFWKNREPLSSLLRSSLIILVVASTVG